MAVVSMIVPKYDSKSGRPKMVIMGSNGDMFEVPWAPRAVAHSNMGEEVVEIERAGRLPEIAVKAPKLPKTSFIFTLGRRIDTSCEPDIERIKAIVNVGGWIQVLYGPQESGLWKCTDLSINGIEREPLQNQISRCEVTMEMTRIPDARVVVAQYSNDFNFRDDATTAGINQSLIALAQATRARTIAASNGSTSTNAGASTTGAITIPPHIVQAGETLLSIANKYYGQYAEQFWRLIGDVNKVAGSLLVGQKLRIP